MKKLMCLVLSVSLALCTFAQTDSVKIPIKDGTVVPLPDSAKVTFSTVYGDVKEGLSGLASALKTGASHVYEVLIKQQIVDSIVNILVYVVLGWFTYYLWSIFRKNYKRLSTENDEWYRDDIGDHTGTLLPLILGIVSLVIIFCFFCGTIRSTVTGFINPEFGAIQDIFDFIHPSSNCK